MIFFNCEFCLSLASANLLYCELAINFCCCFFSARNKFLNQKMDINNVFEQRVKRIRKTQESAKETQK